MEAIKEVTCPNCGKVNTDDWPITVKGKVEQGGCQDCWEADSDKMYWDFMEVLAALMGSEEQPNGQA